MKKQYIVTSFNQECDWVYEYTKNPIIFNRGSTDIPNSIIVENLGTDIADKLRFIVENYDNLPDVCVLIKANLFKYITKEEWDAICDNNTFTPILTKNHRTYSDANGVVCFYDESGMYNERNDYWYLLEHPTKTVGACQELKKLLKMEERKFNCFAPGSNYIVPKANILQHPKDFYQKLLDNVMWERYVGEAFLIERSLYHIWTLQH